MEKLARAVRLDELPGDCPELHRVQAMRNTFCSFSRWWVLVLEALESCGPATRWAGKLGGNATGLKAGIQRGEKASMWPLSLGGLLWWQGWLYPREGRTQFSRAFLPLKLRGER